MLKCGKCRQPLTEAEESAIHEGLAKQPGIITWSPLCSKCADALEDEEDDTTQDF